MRISVIFMTISILLSSNSFASLDIDTTVQECRQDHFCSAYSAGSQNFELDEAINNNLCFAKKVKACRRATIWGGAHARSDQANLSRTILYGNFCGWRNLAHHSNGAKVSWKNAKDVLKAIKETPALDELDQICKIHDQAYFTFPYKICKADRNFVEGVVKLAKSGHSLLSDQAMETGLALAGAIQQASNTCGLLQALKLIGF